MSRLRSGVVIALTGTLAVAYALAQPLPGQWGPRTCEGPDGGNVTCTVTFEQCANFCTLYDSSGCVGPQSCPGPMRYRQCMQVCNSERAWVDTWCVCACLDYPPPTHANCTANP